MCNGLNFHGYIGDWHNEICEKGKVIQLITCVIGLYVM